MVVFLIKKWKYLPKKESIQANVLRCPSKKIGNSEEHLKTLWIIPYLEAVEEIIKVGISDIITVWTNGVCSIMKVVV